MATPDLFEQMRLQAQEAEHNFRWAQVQRIIMAQFFTPRWQFWRHRKLRRYLDIAIKNLDHGAH